MGNIDIRIAELARCQLGVFSRTQLLDAGGHSSMAVRRIREGHWVEESPGVLGINGFPDSFQRRLWIAHTAIGPTSVVSHEAAAQMYGLPGVIRGVVSLTDIHGRHQRIAGPLSVRLRHRVSWIASNPT